MERLREIWELGAGPALRQRQGAVFLADGRLQEIKPDYGFFPWNETIISVVQGVQGSALYILVGVFVVSAVCIAVGHFFLKSKLMQTIGWGVLISTVIIAALISQAGGFIDWGSRQILFH